MPGMALGLTQPDINPVGHFQQAQQAALGAQAQRKEQDLQGIQVLAAGAMATLGGKLDGTPDPQTWETFLTDMERSGTDVSSLRGKPQMAAVVARHGLTAMQQLQLAQDDRGYELALKKFEAELNAAASAQPDAPQIETVYDETTGTERKIQWNGTAWEDVGGVKAPSGPDTVITNNAGATEPFYDKLDQALGTQQAALIDAGRSAASNNIRLGQLETHLANAPQGAEGAVVQFAGQLGIPVEGLDDLQAAQALINQLVPGQRPPGSGTMSDADLELYKKSLPAVINQPGGNAFIITTTRAINDYTIQQADIAQRVADREITPAEGRRLQAAVPNPLSDFKVPQGADRVPTNSSDAPSRPQNQAEFDALPSGTTFIDPTGALRVKP